MIENLNDSLLLAALPTKIHWAHFHRSVSMSALQVCFVRTATEMSPGLSERAGSPLALRQRPAVGSQLLWGPLFAQAASLRQPGDFRSLPQDDPPNLGVYSHDITEILK